MLKKKNKKKRKPSQKSFSTLQINVPGQKKIKEIKNKHDLASFSVSLEFTVDAAVEAFTFTIHLFIVPV